LGASVNEISNDTPILDRELERQIWVAKNLEELIIVARRLPSPRKERTAQSVSLCVNQACDGVMNRFARLIGKRKNTVWGWQHGQTQIPIDDLLRICNRVGISLVDFLYADAFVLDDIDLIQTPTAVSGVKAIGRSPRHLDPKATKAVLLKILKQQTPLPMKEVATRIDLNKRLLYKRFPGLCKAISTRHKEHRRKERQRAHMVITDKINKTRMSLHNIGLYPSRRRVVAAMKSRDGNHFMRRSKIKNLTLAA
jgi:transcriptional regulator with XRE-family HTH domain